ncbi:hypothetical protein BDZ97DRAFT_102259 [Flammula alnicola]|nr:hypothetical protein BDZ97DRAFT_102259 [Flammula alnicola]
MRRIADMHMQGNLRPSSSNPSSKADNLPILANSNFQRSSATTFSSSPSARRSSAPTAPATRPTCQGREYLAIVFSSHLNEERNYRCIICQSVLPVKNSSTCRKYKNACVFVILAIIVWLCKFICAGDESCLRRSSDAQATLYRQAGRSFFCFSPAYHPILP